MKNIFKGLLVFMIGVFALSCTPSETPNDNRLQAPEFNCNVTENSITVSWNAVAGAAYYEISLNNEVERTDKTVHRFDNLKWNAEYTIKLQAISADESKNSAVETKKVTIGERQVPVYREWYPQNGSTATAISDNGRWVVGCFDRQGMIIDLDTDELVMLEKQEGRVLFNSPTKRVGGEPISAFKKHEHISRLYSLNKSLTIQELEAFTARAEKIKNKPVKYTVEYKYDGLTICLTYDNGKFVRATTRGNGIVGEDVTEQVKTIKTFPFEIDYKGTLEVQGEAVIKLSTLKKYNETADEILKNARNAVAGAIRNLDPKVTKTRNLDFFAYNINYIEDKKFNRRVKDKKIKNLHLTLKDIKEGLFHQYVTMFDSNTNLWVDKYSVNISYNEEIEGKFENYMLRVIPCFSYTNEQGQNGVIYYNDELTQVEIEYPLISINNIIEKDNNTNGLFYNYLICFKNMFMQQKNVPNVEFEVFETILYNVPNNIFVDESEQTVINIINYLS